MKFLPTLLAFLPLFPLLSGSASAHPQREGPFMEEFRKAMRINDKDAMKRLVKQNYDQATTAAVEICQEIGKQTNEQLEVEINALSRAWKDATGSSFVDNMYAFFALKLRGEYKKAHADLMERFRPLLRSFLEAEEAKESNKLPAIGQEFAGMGEAFETTGDLYMAGLCYAHHAKCFDKPLRGKDADLRVACAAWKRFVETFDRIELQGLLYDQAKETYVHLEYEGYGDPDKGPEARKRKKAEENPEYAARPLNASFEVVGDLEDFQRPVYTADANYQMWPNIRLQAKGSQGTIESLKPSPKVLRTGSSEAGIDLDGDGTGDVAIPLGGKITPVEVTLGEGDEARPWAFLATVGIERDTYQGFDFNLAPDDRQMVIYIAGAGSIVGMIGETRIQLIDENCDGLYGRSASEDVRYPEGRQYMGVRSGDFQYDVDTVRIGESKTAVPWSELLKVGDAWYKLEPTESGADVLISRSDVDTGTLKVEAKGLKPDWLIVQGVGNLEHCYYLIEKGGTEVPAGSYKLLCGQVSKGKRRQMMKALMLPGSNTPTWSVSAGGEAAIELGAPYRFDFSYSQTEETVEVEGRSVVVVGKSDETYQRLWNCVAMPEVHLRKKGTKRGKEEGKLKRIGAQQEIEEFGNDPVVCWFPLSGSVPKKKKGVEVEVQLFEKKNKLFGKIESDWQ